MPMDRSARVAGAIMGHITSDALGAPLEFMTSDQIREQHGTVTEMIGGGWLDLPIAGTTDDSAMLLSLTDSLIEHPSGNLPDMASRLVRWWLDDPIDVGSTCRSGLHRYARTGELQRPYGEDQAGNGAAMRILAFPLAGLPVEVAIRHAHLTHNNTLSDYACTTYCRMIEAALQGASKEQLAGYAKGYGYDTYNGRASGFIVDTMNTVFHSFFTTDTFEDALIRAIHYGQDSDTVGAILGGLAGCHYGYAAIPSRWRDKLNKSEVARALAFVEAVCR